MTEVETKFYLGTVKTARRFADGWIVDVVDIYKGEMSGKVYVIGWAKNTSFLKAGLEAHSFFGV